MDRISLIITGQVQGVGFRYSARDEAKKLNLVGWAKNRADGKVEVVAEGTKENLQKLIDWAWEGSPAAKVTHVDFEWAESSGEFEEFDIR